MLNAYCITFDMNRLNRFALLLSAIAGFSVCSVPLVAQPDAVQTTADSRIQDLTARKLTLEQRITATATVLAETQAKLADARSRNDSAATALAASVSDLQTSLKSDDAEMRIVEGELAALVVALRAPVEGALTTIGSGEALELYVVEDDSFNGLYQVRQGGYILIPQVGRIQVAGLELSGAEEAVKKALEATQLKEATVLVERPQAGPGSDGKQYVYLAGQFTKTGLFEIAGGGQATIVNTVISAGTNPMADLSKVRLLRLVGESSIVEEVNVAEILRGKGLTEDLRLQAGDILFAPIQDNQRVIYVTGRVGSPGPMEMPVDERLTAYTAILRAGGFARFANLRRVYVIREVGGGQRKQIPVDVVRIQLGLEPDVELVGQDVIVVPEKFFSL